ncbi:uncharacterized protein PV09_02905 [Verruconis gallopava]|uniref:Uncharacterized protein n=1 Tax=Verruconis gallopava TaxID=253628 RepID=A0A0D2AIU9_9PEZI|nr:uncharacterized protein PV09_02905 [Verruconis gallopava]KIW06465.1 hypothetical protein PV09_02905 [Verruconis gallopava]
MFASSQSGAHICLRCQSKFLKARQFSVSARSVTGSRRFISESRRILATPVKTEQKVYPHGKIRGRKGAKVRESSAVLPVSNLGKPAEIILLKDAELDRSKAEEASPAKAPQGPRKSSKKEILDSVARVSDTVDEASTARAIEELRDSILGRAPRKGESIAQAQHEKLIKALEDGFTSSQLRQYATQKGKNLLVRSVKETEKLPHSDWIAGVTPSDEKHLILSGVVSRKTVSKSQFARLIVERGWQLYVDNAMEIGEIDVYDAQSFLQARNEYGNLILDQIAEARHVKMHALTDKVLRITGSREAATAALNDISQKCLAVQSDKIKLIQRRLPRDQESTSDPSSLSESAPATVANFLSLAARAPIGSHELEVLKSTTGVMAKTLVDKRSQKPYLMVNGYSVQQIDDARRALASMSNLATRSIQLFIAFPKLGSRKGPAQSADSLNYHERRIPRRRNVGDTPRRDSQAENVNLSEQEDVIRTLTRAATEKLVPSPPSATESPVWTSQPERSYASRLGFVFWPKKTNKAAHSFKPAPVFAPGLVHVPPLLTFLSSAAEVAPTRNIISFSFRHDPLLSHQSSKNAKKVITKVKWDSEPLPEIKFDFELDHTGTSEPAILSVHAVTRDTSLCISLPGKPIDYCVTEKHIHKLDHANKSVKGVFTPVINAMKSSIQGSERLRAPPAINIPVPRSWWSQSTNAASLLPTYKTDDLKESHIKAHYRFVGVEHKQVIHFKMNGVQHRITMNEGGKLGAKYTELCVLQPAPEAKSKEGTECREATLRSVIEAGLKMVEMVERAVKQKLKVKESVEKISDTAPAQSIVTGEQSEDEAKPIHESVVGQTSEASEASSVGKQEATAASG